MTVRLQKEIDKYKDVLPVLKWVRGEPLSQDHWLEVFRLLKMPKGTTLEKLTFGLVLASSDHIIQNADALKVRANILLHFFSHYSNSQLIFCRAKFFILSLGLFALDET